ncbi:MAG: GTP 3',8-cyclase MoaA [Candidatus Eisenbacteria bacterium]|uniref:GTP 3',8-cyclase n=1 Tax=Eiseniibacteriota bacterium TaxID=2212470 RepID=A0A538UCG3_UNCEI|nr:MAG: GTP 3',8-cyclase MoaA [Candidatus Eisenbacteria bacterium]
MTPASTLVDTQGRVVRDLRISVTDRCNLRCVYCMPAEGMPWLPKGDLLSYEEIARFTRVCLSLGVTGVRLTGGEPTVRADLPVLVRLLNDLAPDLDLSLTTNGLKLTTLAGELRAAGLKRVNVSLDTLDPQRFQQIARRDRFHEVIAGLAAARAAGLSPIKVNAVLMRDFNEDEVVPLARWARENGYELRFIEWMPLDFGHTWERWKLVPAAEIVARIHAEFPLEAARVTDPSAPATLYRYLDGGGSVGVIASVTRPFCGHCDRIRLTADGQIRTCLFSLKEYDFRRAMRAGAPDETIAEMLRAAVWRKEPGHLINSPYFKQPERGMSAIGG